MRVWVSIVLVCLTGCAQVVPPKALPVKDAPSARAARAGKKLSAPETRTVILSWDALNEANVVGYRVKWGETTPDSVRDAGTALEASFQFPLFTQLNLWVCAYNAEGIEGQLSNPTILPPTELELFRIQYFGRKDNAGDAANDANPLHDGIPNLVKFACWMNPTVPLAPEKFKRVGCLTTTKTYARFTYYRSKEGRHDNVQYQVEWSFDLKTWAAGGTETVIAGTDYDVVTNTTNRNSVKKKFARLRVIYPLNL